MSERPVPEEKVEFISEYDYERARGHNAAVTQFINFQLKDESDGLDFSVYKGMIVDLSRKRVSKYTSSEEDSKGGYADGYHEALEILYRSRNCARD